MKTQTILKLNDISVNRCTNKSNVLLKLWMASIYKKHKCAACNEKV